ncbi:MAG: autotransporter domain-containing protein [Candidatus Spyradosoma sp.]
MFTPPLRIREHEIPAKLVDSQTVGGTIVLESGATLDVNAGATMTLDGGEIRFETDGNESGLVSVKQGGGIVLSDAARLVVEFTGSVSDDSEISILTWEEGSTLSGLDSLIKGWNVFLKVNGEAYDEALWDFSTDGNALIVTFGAGYEVLIEFIDQTVNLPGAEYVGTFDSNLREFQGSISGSGEVHSGYDLTFAGDASAHTGTTHIDGGKFTIVDAARLGTGAFEVADAGTLRIEGTRDFANTLSGGGTLESAGTITLSGDASGFSGVTKVESGTLKIADTATLGTGAFEVAGTLSLNGDRTFGNATSGDGVLEIASGTTMFTRDVGTRILSVRNGAEATLGSGVSLTHANATADVSGTLNLQGDRTFSATLTGSGALTTNGTISFESNASGFSGVTKVESGTLKIADTATLGTGAFEVAGTLSLNGDRTFGNATSGDGVLEVASGTTTFMRDVGTKTFSVGRDAEATFVDGIGFSRADATADVAGTLKLAGMRTFGAATYGSGLLELLSGADVKFSSPVGVRTLRVDAGATLNGGVRLTYGAGAALNLSGTLALNADAGEKVSLASTATLDLYGAGGGRDAGTDAASTFASTSPISALSEGSLVTIFEGGTVSGDVVSFLSADSELSGFARDYAVVFDTANGLTVRIVRSVRADVSAVRMPSGWRKAFEALVADFALDLAPGFHDVRTLGNVGAAGSSDDPLISAILNDPEAARVMAMNILPGHYAAAVAMKAEGFHSDVRDVSARLEQRRWDGFSENGRFEFFAQGRGGFTENDDSDDSPTYDVNAWGVLVGGDYKTDSRTVVGLAVATEYDEAKIHDGGGKLRMTDTRLTGYFGKTFEERLYVNAGAQLGSARVEARRRSVWGDPKGETTAWNAGVFFEAGALIPLEGNFALMPYVGADYAHAWAESFREEGADAQWDVDSAECDSLRARVGCGASWQCVLDGDRKLRVGVNAEYAHEFLGDEIDVDAKRLGGGRLPTITAKALPQDVFSVGPTVNVDVSPSASVYAGYSFSAGTDSSTTHSANVGFRMRF